MKNVLKVATLALLGCAFIGGETQGMWEKLRESVAKNPEKVVNYRKGKGLPPAAPDQIRKKAAESAPKKSALRKKSAESAPSKLDEVIKNNKDAEEISDDDSEQIVNTSENEYESENGSLSEEEAQNEVELTKKIKDGLASFVGALDIIGVGSAGSKILAYCKKASEGDSALVGDEAQGVYDEIHALYGLDDEESAVFANAVASVFPSMFGLKGDSFALGVKSLVKDSIKLSEEEVKWAADFWKYWSCYDSLPEE